MVEASSHLKIFWFPQVVVPRFPLPNIKASTLWKLLKEFAPLIQSRISCALGNGASINLWSNSIMRKKSLMQNKALTPFWNWSNKGLTRLSDIS